MDKNMLDTPLKNASEYSEFVKTASEGYVEAPKNQGESYYIKSELDGVGGIFDLYYKIPIREQEEAEKLQIKKYLYDEWMVQVKAFRGDALKYDFYLLARRKSDSELIELMLLSMSYELTTPRILMEKARIRLTREWIEWRASMTYEQYQEYVDF